MDECKHAWEEIHRKPAGNADVVTYECSKCDKTKRVIEYS